MMKVLISYHSKSYMIIFFIIFASINFYACKNYSHKNNTIHSIENTGYIRFHDIIGLYTVKYMNDTVIYQYFIDDSLKKFNFIDGYRKVIPVGINEFLFWPSDARYLDIDSTFCIYNSELDSFKWFSLYDSSIMYHYTMDQKSTEDYSYFTPFDYPLVIDNNLFFSYFRAVSRKNLKSLKDSYKYIGGIGGRFDLSTGKVNYHYLSEHEELAKGNIKFPLIYTFQVKTKKNNIIYYSRNSSIVVEYDYVTDNYRLHDLDTISSDIKLHKDLESYYNYHKKSTKKEIFSEIRKINYYPKNKEYWIFYTYPYQSEIRDYHDPQTACTVLDSNFRFLYTKVTKYRNSNIVFTDDDIFEQRRKKVNCLGEQQAYDDLVIQKLEFEENLSLKNEKKLESNWKGYLDLIFDESRSNNFLIVNSNSCCKCVIDLFYKLKDTDINLNVLFIGEYIHFQAYNINPNSLVEDSLLSSKFNMKYDCKKYKDFLLPFKNHKMVSIQNDMIYEKEIESNDIKMLDSLMLDFFQD